MRYQVGRTGRVIVARFEDREDVLGNLTDIARKVDLPLFSGHIVKPI